MTTPVDINSLKTWEDAFQHPIPQVRQLERQLRTDLAANKERLRGLVGESYRDLLKTAETIMEMDTAAQKVEMHLADTSKNCNSRLLDRKARNLKIFQEKIEEKDREAHSFGAQLAVLQNCPSVVSRLLHRDRGESCLLATKVLSISRLLLKSLSQKNSVPLLDQLRDQLAVLRTVLLQHIDSLISAESLPTQQLIAALTSFSVVKISSPVEILRHFLYIRSTTLTSRLAASGTPDSKALLESVIQYNKTLRDVEDIFPRQMSESLIVLKSKSLLQDSEMSAVPELGLGVNGRWLPGDIRGFIPWVRHDDLDRERVTEQVSAWATKELGNINASFGNALDHIKDIEEVVKLRVGILGLWRSSRKTRNRFLEDGERFREFLNSGIAAIMKEESEKLRHVGEKVQELLEGSHDDNEGTDLWSTSLLSMELSNGALEFREAITARVHGRDSAVKSFLEEYQLWLKRIEYSATVVKNIGSPDSGVSDDEEDFDMEEERTQEGLEDCETAERELTAALDGVYKRFEKSLGHLVASCEEDKEGTTEDAKGTGQEAEDLLRQAAFLLRVIREIRQQPPKRGDDVLLPLSWFCTALIPRLHAIIANGVCRKPSEKMEGLLNKRSWAGKVASKPLWEGAPSLPVQPSPMVFKFLHDIVKAMGAIGEDIWAPAAVKHVKTKSSDQVWRVLKRILQGREIAKETDSNDGQIKSPITPEKKDAPNASGNVKENENEKGVIEQLDDSSQTAPTTNDNASEIKSKEAPVRFITDDWTIQLMFDALYLDEALQRKSGKGASVGSAMKSLSGKVDSIIGSELHLDQELRMRLEGSASEYWKRTCLLFALLA